MKVHIMKPYALDKNLGRAYNEAMAMIPEGDWACLMDYDTMLLTPNSISIMYTYIDIHEYAGMLTCFTNRIGNKCQLVKDLHDSRDVLDHITQANLMETRVPASTYIKEPISGFLMLISKSTWNKIKFDESGKCLGVDNDYSRRILEAGMSIVRMDALYVFHIYRMKQGVKNKLHLL